MAKENFLPATGTRDIDPTAAEIRDNAADIIVSNYKKLIEIGRASCRERV